MLGPFPVDLAADDSVTGQERYALRTYAQPGALVDLGMACAQTLLVLMRSKGNVHVDKSMLTWEGIATLGFGASITGTLS